MLIDDEITTRTTRRWHHICQWNRLNEYCYKCSHTLQTYRHDTLHTNMNNWLLRGWNSKFIRAARSAMQPVSHSVSQSLNHPLSWFLSESVRPSVRPSVSQSTRRAFTACPGVAVSCVLVCLLSYLRHRFPFFWCAVMMHREMRWCTPYNGYSRSMDYCRAITEQSVTICFSWISWFECCWLFPYENVVLWDDARILDSSYLVSTTFFY